MENRCLGIDRISVLSFKNALKTEFLEHLYPEMMHVALSEYQRPFKTKEFGILHEEDTTICSIELLWGLCSRPIFKSVAIPVFSLLVLRFFCQKFANERHLRPHMILESYSHDPEVHFVNSYCDASTLTRSAQRIVVEKTTISEVSKDE